MEGSVVAQARDDEAGVYISIFELRSVTDEAGFDGLEELVAVARGKSGLQCARRNSRGETRPWTMTRLSSGILQCEDIIS